jgi:hypothetical protein
MSFTIIELPDLDLLVAKADRFPEGAPAAFEKVESRLPSLRGRKLYGVVFGGANGIEYYAGAARLDADEGERLGLPLLTVAAGTWARAKLVRWQERRDEIGSLVDRVIADAGIDSSRPVLEYYKTASELHVLVPVSPRPDGQRRHSYGEQLLSVEIEDQRVADPT